MKKTVKKLVLSKETLRDSDGIVGGLSAATNCFANTCVTCHGSVCTPTCLPKCA